jgi:hypothetical protein
VRRTKVNPIETTIEITVRVTSRGQFKTATAEQHITLLDKEDICGKCVIQKLIESTENDLKRQEGL